MSHVVSAVDVGDTHQVSTVGGRRVACPGVANLLGFHLVLMESARWEVVHDGDPLVIFEEA